MKKTVSDKSKKNLIPWEKGQSGNPRGKITGTRNRSTIVREILKLAGTLPDNSLSMLQGIFPGIEKDMSVEEAMTLIMVKKVIKEGDVSAYVALLDSAYGKNFNVSISDGTFEDATQDELDSRFYLPGVGSNGQSN